MWSKQGSSATAAPSQEAAQSQFKWIKWSELSDQQPVETEKDISRKKVWKVIFVTSESENSDPAMSSGGLTSLIGFWNQQVKICIFGENSNK